MAIKSQDIEDFFAVGNDQELVDRFLELKTRNEFLEEQQKTLEDGSAASSVSNVVNTDENNKIPVVYGHRRVSGQIIWAYQGTDPKVLYVCYAISEGQITNVQKCFFNGQFVSQNMAFVHNSKRPIYRGAAQYNDTLVIEFLDGRDNAYSDLVYDDLSIKVRWPNLACVVMKFTKSAARNPYLNGVPNVDFEIHGKFGRNPNPADVLLDILTNTRYGFGLSSGLFDFSTAQSYFNQKVNYTSVRQDPRFTCERIFDPTNPLQQEVTSFLNEYHCHLSKQGNTFVLIPERAESPTFNITDDYIYGDVIVAHPDAQTSARYISVRYPSKETPNFSPLTQYAQTETGGFNQIQIETKGITNGHQARQIAFQTLKKSQEQKTFSLVIDKVYRTLNVGDVITIPQGTVRIIEKRTQPDTNIEIKAVTHDNDFYAINRGTFTYRQLKPQLPTGGGNVQIGDPGGGGTGGVTNPNPTPPGEIQPPPPPTYTISGAQTLDDNTDWYLAYSEDGETQGLTLEYINGVRNRLYGDTFQPNVRIFQQKVALLSRKYTINKPERIMVLHSWNSGGSYVDQVGMISFRSSNQSFAYYTMQLPEQDPNQGFNVKIGSYNFSRTVEQVADDFPGIVMQVDSLDRAGQYTMNTTTTDNNTGIHGVYINPVFAGNGRKPTLNSYSLDVNGPGTHTLYFLGQNVTGSGEWFYIGKKAVDWYRGSLTDLTMYGEKFQQEARGSLTTSQLSIGF